MPNILQPVDKKGSSLSDKRKLILVGPDYTEAEVATRRNSSPASAAWMRSFIKLLDRVDGVDASFWFTMERAWPRGKFVVPSDRFDREARSRHLIGYLNLPAAKRYSISRSLTNAIANCASSGDDVIIYGQRTLTSNDFARLAGRVRRLFLIIPDALPGLRGEEEILTSAQHATGGVIYLPAALGEALGNRRSFHFPGVVNPTFLVKSQYRQCPRRLVFVGGVDRFSGAHFLREALEIANLPDYKIVVMGHIADQSEAEKLRELGVEVTGFVNEDRMLTECSQAFAFLNPRDPRMKESALNFPSKLLLYLRFGHPVVSTDTLGVPRFLADAMGCLGIYEPAAFARQLEELFNADDCEVKRRSDRLRRVVTDKFTEDAVIMNLRKFLHLEDY